MLPVANAVQAHYDQRPAESHLERNQNPIIGLKRLNNLLKRAVLAEAIAAQTDAKEIVFLDLCGGKGGDMQKIIQHCKENRLSLRYLLIDLSNAEVQRAKDRFARLPREDADVVKQAVFQCANVLDLSTADFKNCDSFVANCNVVSCQFAMQYFCGQPQHHKTFWKVVDRFAAEQAFFVASFPARKRVEQWINAKADNSLCQLTRIDPTFYQFNLHGAINACPEMFMPTAREIHQCAQNLANMVCQMHTTADRLFCAKQEHVNSPSARTALIEATFVPVLAEEHCVACLYEYVIFRRDTQRGTKRTHQHQDEQLSRNVRRNK